jgi:2-oxoglutarate dehydrogenase E2 component (dihydrolipoamide succinyltransferase)
MSVEITVPEVGESIQEVQILQWKKRKGDHVEKDEDLVEIETDKATVAIPSPASGNLEEILKGDGDYAEVGDVIATITKGEEASAEKDGAKRAPQRRSDEKQQAPGKKQGATQGGGKSKTETDETDREPARRRRRDESEERRVKDQKPRKAEQPVREQPARREERQEGKRQQEQRREKRETTQQQPSRGEEEVEAPESPAEVEQREVQEQRARPPVAVRDDAREGREERRVPMSILRRTVARRLVQAQQNAALVTTFNEIDMQEAINLRNQFKSEFREQFHVKLGYMSLFVKAAVEALKEYPEVNAKVVDNDIVYRNYFDIGIAIGSDKGLVVPVLRDCQRLSFAEIERQIDDFAMRADQGRIEPEELEGGTFTITNGGIYGSLLSTPIVNPPQSGVLGMHAIGDRPVARDGRVVIRPMMYVALTYDHRIVDGREAVGFLVKIREIVETPARLLLEV